MCHPSGCVRKSNTAGSLESFGHQPFQSIRSVAILFSAISCCLISGAEVLVKRMADTGTEYVKLECPGHSSRSTSGSEGTVQAELHAVLQNLREKKQQGGRILEGDQRLTCRTIQPQLEKNESLHSTSSQSHPQRPWNPERHSGRSNARVREQRQSFEEGQHPGPTAGGLEELYWILGEVMESVAGVGHSARVRANPLH